MSHRSSSHTSDPVSESRHTPNYFAFTYLTQNLKEDSSIDSEPELETSSRWTMSCGAMEFFGTYGVVGLLTWFESMEYVLYISMCLAESQFKFASCMMQGRALTWWNTLVQTRGRAAAIAQPWEDFKKLLME
ncbi:hypothetical protein Tco_0542803 [Tanacetum coccineum]